MGVTIKNTIHFPKLEFQKDLRFIADNIFIPEIQANIDRGEAIDGGAYPALDTKTIARKSGKISKSSGKLIKKAERLEKAAESSGLREARSFLKQSGKYRSLASSFSVKTLIETGKLIRSFYSENLGKGSVRITLKADRKDIGKYLQIDGIGKAKKHFNFFGINPKMENKAMAYIKNKIDEAIKNGKKS